MLPSEPVHFVETQTAGGVDDLIVHREGEGEEVAALLHGAFAKPVVTDVVQQLGVDGGEVGGGGAGRIVGGFAAVGDAGLAILDDAADPGDEPEGEGDDVVEAV